VTKKLLLVPVVAVALLCLLAAPALASPKTFYVHPSGGNDTVNIQNAFNAAVKAGPGSTVQLTAGQFYTSTIFVRNFHGCFKGAGEAKTVIDTVAGERDARDTLPKQDRAFAPWERPHPPGVSPRCRV
jgi:hypothetical protein